MNHLCRKGASARLIKLRCLTVGSYDEPVGWLSRKEARICCQYGSRALPYWPIFYECDLGKWRYIVRGAMPRILAAFNLFPAHCSIVASTNCLVASSTVVPTGMDKQEPFCASASVFGGLETCGANAKSVMIFPCANATAR